LADDLPVEGRAGGGVEQVRAARDVDATDLPDGDAVLAQPPRPRRVQRVPVDLVVGDEALELGVHGGADEREPRNPSVGLLPAGELCGEAVVAGGADL